MTESNIKIYDDYVEKTGNPKQCPNLISCEITYAFVSKAMLGHYFDYTKRSPANVVAKHLQICQLPNLRIKVQ